MKWVTFYWNAMSGVHDLIVHENKRRATDHFRRCHTDYFQIGKGMDKIELPASYGYPHRRFFGMTLKMFEQEFGGVEND